MSEIKGTVLVAMPGRIRREGLIEELQNELSEFTFSEADNCDTIEQAILANDDLVWVILQENLRKHPTEASLRLGKRPHAVSLAEKYSEYPSGVRFIVVTVSPWQCWNWQLDERLLAIHDDPGTLGVDIADMIGAGESGQVYLSPSVIDLTLRRKESSGWSLWVSCSRREVECAHGWYLRDVIPDEPEPIDLPESGLSEIGDSPETGKGQHGALCSLSDKIGNALFKHSSFQAIEKARSDFMQHRWRGSSQQAPPLLHLHIHGRQEALHYPLDCALHPTSRKHLGELFPLVWRLESDRGYHQVCGRNSVRVRADLSDSSDEANDFDDELRENLGEVSENPAVAMPWDCKGEFGGATSCSQPVQGLKKILSNRSHVEDVDKGVHWCRTLGNCHDMADFADFVTFINGDRGACRQYRYVLTHGYRDETLAGQSGLVIGPDEKGTACIVTAERLKAALGDKELSVLFVNSCGLGFQADKDEASKDYFGGFLTGVIGNGSVIEAIGHRWSVVPRPAMELAEKFFSTQGRTVQSRATTLFHSRNAIRITFAQTLDVSWLAPVHVFRGG